MKKFILISLLTLFLAALPQSNAMAKDDYTLSEGELAQILAPIALYPDSLLSHILIASTYPIEVVEAYRWLEENDQLGAEQIFARVENKNWDASVKALLPFPTVLKRLNDDLSWSQNIGDAFLADENQVLTVIQQLRQQADKAGNLSQMENMSVNYENDDIVIEPIKQAVVYVPYYDSRSIYGDWYWRSYPPVYWANTRMKYRYYNGYYAPVSAFYWQPGVHISFNYYFGAFRWNQRQLVVINHANTRNYNRQRIITSSGSKRWHHKPQHRRGVAYSTNHVTKRYNGHKVSVAQRNKARLSTSNGVRHQQLMTKQKSHYNRNKSAANTNLKRTNVKNTQVRNTNVSNNTVVKNTVVNKTVVNNTIVNRSGVNKSVANKGNNKQVRAHHSSKSTVKKTVQHKVNMGPKKQTRTNTTANDTKSNTKEKVAMRAPSQKSYAKSNRSTQSHSNKSYANKSHTTRSSAKTYGNTNVHKTSIERSISKGGKQTNSHSKSRKH